MDSNLDIACAHLLAPAELTVPHLEALLARIRSRSIDYADLYFQRWATESWRLEDSIVKAGGYHSGSGVGVRAVSEEKTGFSYTDEIRLGLIEQAASAACKVVPVEKQVQIPSLSAVDYESLYPNSNPLTSWTAQQKVALLHKVDALVRRMEPAITEVAVTLVASWDVVLVAATDGTLAADIRPLIRFSLTVNAEKNGRRETARAGGGGRFGYCELDEDKVLEWAQTAVQRVRVNLESVDAPAGAMPVVLGPGWPGVLLHEAVGHGLEGDYNRKGSSTFSGRIGELVASPLCTVIDDGTLPDRRGSLSIDDEGVPAQKTVLIEKGVLKGYMQDKLNARLMGEASTGNGRRQSYDCLPLPRMRNTYLLPGEDAPEDIIRSVKKGLYAVNFGSGQVNTTSGNFVFSANEAYLIEDGRITAPVKGATLTGNGPEVMQKISMVGHDLKLDEGVGRCGKAGQTVPVGVGQPTLKVDEIIVGGTGG